MHDFKIISPVQQVCKYGIEIDQKADHRKNDDKKALHHLLAVIRIYILLYLTVGIAEGISVRI